MGDGQSDHDRLAYRLSKGLTSSHAGSRDLRANPLPVGPQTCVACGQRIPADEATSWLDGRPHHVPCGRSEAARREAASRAERERRLRPRPPTSE